ncbi:MAG: cell division protein ZapA [Blautia sp.]|nr:cell division protein ZapA [Blautia sp.]
MAVKNKAQVIIGGKVITLSGYESEEYLHLVATYMNRKISELSEMPGYSRLPMETKHNLLSLNISDDYFKAKKQAEDYEQDMQRKDQEVFDLKHELIDVRMKLEEAQRSSQEAEDARQALESRIELLEKEADERLDQVQKVVREAEEEKQKLLAEIARLRERA